jgi:predicted DNA-binding transcriptional regulator AlpA
LRTFDAALKHYLIEETTADMRALLDSMTRASQLNADGAELTGKQTLRYMVGSFCKSPDAQAVEAYISLGKFRVHDPSNPLSWEQSFLIYSTQVFIASGADATVEMSERNVQIMLYGIEKYLQISEVEKVRELKESLRMHMKNKPRMLPSEKVAWYRSEIAEWGDMQKEWDTADCARLRDDTKHPYAQAIIENDQSIKQHFRWDEVQRYWIFDNKCSLQQMKAIDAKMSGSQ